MNEVAGDGALLCDPFDTHSIRARIQELKRNPDQREELIQKGFENCNNYTPSTPTAMLQFTYLKCYTKLFS